MVSRNGPLLVIVLVARNFYMTSDYIVVYHVPGAARSLQTHNGSERTPPTWGTSRPRTLREDDDLLLSGVGS